MFLAVVIVKHNAIQQPDVVFVVTVLEILSMAVVANHTVTTERESTEPCYK